MVAFQGEALNLEYINSDLFNKLMKLKNCDFNKNCLTATLKELKRTYLEEKDGLFTFQVPVVRQVFLIIFFRNIRNLSHAVMKTYENDACVRHYL